MTAPAFGLHRVSDAELKRLLRALHRGALPSPITRAALIEKAFGHLEAQLDPLVGRDLAAAKALVIAVLGERSSAHVHAGSRLVYAGPPAPGTRSRDLVEQVCELLASATQSAHLYGLILADDRGLLGTLAALVGGRGVRVRLVFDGYGVDESAARVRAFVSERLGARAEQFALFVCARARLRGRAVVVDGEHVLLTSGELTSCEEDGYIDFGVASRDAELARALEDEWQKLLALAHAWPVPNQA